MSDTRPAAPDNASLNALLDAMREVARAPAPEFHCPSCGAPAIVTARRHVYPCPFDGDEVGQESRSDNVACCCVPVPSDWICGEPSPAPEPSEPGHLTRADRAEFNRMRDEHNPSRKLYKADEVARLEREAGERAVAQEKERRVYYQNLCYEVANHLDKVWGRKITVGTVGEPCAELVDAAGSAVEAGERMVRRFVAYMAHRWDDQPAYSQAIVNGAERFLKEGA